MAKLKTATVTLPNGKRKYIRAKTQEELKLKVAQARLEMGAGVDISDDTTVAQLAQLWYDVCKKPLLRPTAAESIVFTLNHYALPTWLGGMQVRDVRPVHIQRVMSDISSYSRSTQSKAIQILRGIFQFGVDNGLIGRTPCISTIKARGDRPEERVPLTPEQSARLLKAVEGTRAYPVVALMLGCGLRRGEVLGLMWEDVDLDLGYIYVRHNKPIIHGQKTKVSDELKTRAGRRDIPMPLWLTVILTKEKEGSKSAYVISMPNGDSLTESSFDRLWGLIDARTTDDPKKLGTAVWKHPSVVYSLDFHVYPHLLRHTCITRWFESGLDIKEVQYLAGHATPEMTLRVYAHYDRVSRAQETAQKIKNLPEPGESEDRCNVAAP